VTEDTTVITSFVYDALGRRVKKKYVKEKEEMLKRQERMDSGRQRTYFGSCY